MKVNFVSKENAKQGLLLLLVILLFFFSAVRLTKPAEQGPRPMNLSITVTIGLTLSDKLNTEIFYTNSTCAETNTKCDVESGWNNATWNYVGSFGTYYNITNEGNTYENICGKADDDLICPGGGCVGEKILIANATWSNGTSATAPAFPATNVWTKSYSTANFTAVYLAANGKIHIRYWVNIPAGVTPGVYNTTYRYCAVEYPNPCSAC